ncbi:hypothetical protein [Halorussus sp. MSC15.2]|uniref:hypothetical protein n=1 Tax=Halorussus sp. MSC15.2 TaxID=2283638 RepID=UPI0013D762D3|nr:hypothetical protein [Halorussus sp. MSC15.2]NEU58250.1 hypothetical protein [Halorussus sp. MSC15.2]
MVRLKILVAVMLVLALFSGATAGVAVAQGESDENHCRGLHNADERTDGTSGEDTVRDVHSLCHHGELG